MPNLEEVDWSYTEILISFDNEKFLIQVNSLILLGRKMSKYLTSIFAGRTHQKLSNEPRYRSPFIGDLTRGTF